MGRGSAIGAISLYKRPIQAGLDEEDAKQISEEVVIAEDAKTFATMADLTELKSSLIVWLIGLHMTIIGLGFSPTPHSLLDAGLAH